MKKLFLSTLLMALPLLASAYDIAIKNTDGITIYYNSINNGTELEVTYRSSDYYDSYSGVVNIPEEVVCNSGIRKVTRIGQDAFYDCTDLTSVTIPNSVTSIGISAFGNCSSLLSVAIPNSVTSIGGGAFSDCSSLISVAIPNSVTSIGDYTFGNCTSLLSVIIPNSVTSIGGHAFWNCYRMTSVTIPNSVTSIGGGAFSDCSSLTSVTIPNSVTSIGGGAFSDCSSLISVAIPNSITSIGDGSFWNCYSLTSVTIPNSVTSIGGHAFYKCANLTTVTIPSSVTSIGEKAFQGCTSLTSVISKMKDPCIIDDPCFDQVVYNNATLYVPQGTTGEYQLTNNWNKFLSVDDGHICATPTISFANKKLTFSCETEGVDYVYEIKDVDVKKGYDAAVDLSATYNISVYATKPDFGDSDVATATLVWTNAVYSETTGIVTSAKAIAESIPLLISVKDGKLIVKSEQEGQFVAVYSIDGKALGSAKVKGGQANIPTNLPKDEIVIVKVGNRSVKVKI